MILAILLFIVGLAMIIFGHQLGWWYLGLVVIIIGIGDILYSIYTKISSIEYNTRKIARGIEEIKNKDLKNKENK